MKTLKKANFTGFQDCLKIRHSFFLVVTCFVFSSANAIEENLLMRNPASIEEEVLTVPLDQDTFSNDVLFAEDDAGIMKEMRNSLSAWEQTDEYARLWDLKSTGLYNTPDTKYKQQYIIKKMLRYADKRLAGEMKKADEGSTLYKMSRVEKQLRPNAAINVSKNFGLKFKARVLQGKATVEVKNPWIDCNATVSANGKTRILTKKDFKNIGLSSGAEYSVSDSQLVAFVDQQVTENIKARVSSTQAGGANVFGDNADAKIEMTASFPFNL